MCWLTNYKPKKETAKEDIEVYKIFTSIGDIENTLYSPIFGTGWILNSEYSTNLGKPCTIKSIYGKKYSTNIINEGYHSLEKPPVYNNETYSWYTATNYLILVTLPNLMYEICKCIIPKGAHYYKNEEGKIVSDRLKVIEVLNY